MSLSSPFIHRPVGTSLLTVGLALAGAIGYRLLPVAPLPEVEFPTISVSASLPGASPETMASSVATPLERQFGRIAAVTEMTSTSGLGSTNIVLQFDLTRDIDSAARDVQAAINAARGYLPADLPTNPTYRKVNPADAPILILALTSDAYAVQQMYDAANSILAQKLSQVQGVGQVTVGGGASPAVRVELNPRALESFHIGLDQVSAALAAANAHTPTGSLAGAGDNWQVDTTDQLPRPRLQQAGGHLPERRHRPPRRYRHHRRFGAGPPQRRPRQRQARRPHHHLPPAPGQHDRNRGPRARPAAAPARLHSRRPSTFP